jgi:hypothetical protein
MTIARFLLAASLLGTAASAAAQPQVPRARPKLVVAISVDQLSSDLFEAYRPHFTRGLKRLSGGTVFRNGYQAHAASETCPGHSTILTGSHPARTGIIANNWFDPTLAGDKKVYCAEDVARRPAPVNGRAGYTVSATHLKVPTLGDSMKAATPATRVVSVSGKDRAAVMLAGRSADQVFWWSGSGFTSNMTARPAASVAQVNEAVAGVLARPRAALVPPPVCEGKARPITLPGGRQLNTVRFARAAGDAAAFRNSPEVDGATLALAAGMTRELGLGRGAATDVLAIGLSATDFIGHAYGSGGIEQCLNIMSLDRDLGDFMGVLDRLGVDYQVVLTADHGVLDVPERGTMPGAARIDPALTIDALNAHLTRTLGLAQAALIGEGVSDLYVDGTLAPAMRARVLAETARFLRDHPQVHSVLTGAEVARVAVPTGSPAGWTVPQRVRASYDPKRSGDLLVILKSQVMPIATPGPGYAATHGSPWDYDRRVPVIFWRSGGAAAERNEAVATVDILPTVASMIGLSVPASEIDGKCLTVMGSSCGTR